MANLMKEKDYEERKYQLAVLDTKGLLIMLLQELTFMEVIIMARAVMEAGGMVGVSTMYLKDKITDITNIGKHL